MTDKEFLSWVADRLVHVYGESQSVDFVQKLRKISQRTWVGLDEEDDIDWEEGGSLRDLVEAVEAKLRSKNEDCMG